MKIGIYGGAFNPVHNGHLHLAECYIRELKLDKIIFVPTCVSPHKSSDNLISGKDRIKMLELALSDKNDFEISDIEFHRSGKSYTYDTICELKKIYPDDELFLIVGSDQYLYFHKWYKSEDILKNVTLCTAARENNELKKMQQFKNEYADMKNSIISSFDAVVVSSSQIRYNIKNENTISELVPKKVEEYIKEHKLYV